MTLTSDALTLNTCLHDETLYRIEAKSNSLRYSNIWIENLGAVPTTDFVQGRIHFVEKIDILDAKKLF